MSSSIFTHPEISLSLKAELVLAILFGGVWGVISSWTTQRTWKRSVHISITRRISNILSRDGGLISLKLAGGSTRNTYRSWASAKQMPITSEDTGEGGRLHWIGEKRLNKVLLYFHGGAFAFPAADNCYDAVLSLKEDADNTGESLGVAFLDYSLTPAAPFPMQLRQATSALAHLISQGVSPSNIILGGDSAGGSIALQLCSHILHPLSDLPTPPRLSNPLAGIVLISPWISFHDRYESFKTNAQEDVIPPQSFMGLGKIASVGITEKMRNHLEPAAAPPEWWTGISNVVSRVLITIGEKECLFDQDMDLSRSLGPYTQVQTVVQKNGVHEDFVLAFGAGPQEGRAGDDYKAVVAWVKSVLD